MKKKTKKKQRKSGDWSNLDAGFLEATARCEKLEKKLKKHPMFKADAKSGGAERLAIQQFEKKAALDEEAAQLRSEIKSTELSKFRHELASRARVLQRLGHVDEDQVVQLKGRAACEVDTADELLVTELMFNGGVLQVVELG